KGNVFLGKFVDNTLSSGKILQMNGITYTGSIKDFKKEGDKEIETKEDKYVFKGKFVENKRISGKFTVLNHPCIQKISVSDYSSFNKRYNSNIKFLFKNTKIKYKGQVENRKLDDE